MSAVSWIKISTCMFEDEKIDFIQSLPEGDALLVIWVRLLTMAGRCNAGGYIMLTESIPYTDEMLATRFRKPLNIVKLAIQTFGKLGMVQMSDNGIYIANWEKHQNIDALEKIREQTRQRVAKHRELKQIGDNVTVTHDVTQGNATDLDLDKELDIDNKRLLSAGADSLIELWNDLHKTKLRTTKERARQIKTRLKTYTLEELKQAVNNLSKSPFHCGQNDRGWRATPEWLFKSDSKVDEWLNVKPSAKLQSADSYDDAELILRRMQKAAAGKGRE